MGERPERETNEQGKGVGAMAILLSVGVVAGTTLAAGYVDENLIVPVLVVSTVATIAVLRLGPQARTGFMLAFAVSLVLVGGSCVALLVWLEQALST